MKQINQMMMMESTKISSRINWEINFIKFKRIQNDWLDCVNLLDTF